MSENLFLNEEKNDILKRWSFFSLSFFVHILLISMLFIIPFLDFNIKLPDLKVVDIYVSHITPEAPGSMRAMKKISQKMSKLVDKKEIKNDLSQQLGVLIVPIEIPEEIIDEEDELIVSDIEFGSGGGLEDGINGGFDDGIIGGSLLGQTPVWISQPRRTKYVKPVYPPEALEAKMGAAVIIEAITDLFGRVTNWKIISGHSSFNFAAIEAISQWEYEPYIIKGIPKPVVFRVTINFMPFITYTVLERGDQI